MKFKFYFRKTSFKKDLDSARLLLLEIEKYKPANFLEVGVYQGVTSRNVCETLNKIHNIFPEVRLLQTYGLIELGVLASKSEYNNSLWVKVGGLGYQTRVINGMLEIKSRSTMLGYLNAQSPLSSDGWFRTKDAVEVKPGYIKILGRKSELIHAR